VVPIQASLKASARTLCFLRALGRTLVRPALGQDCAAGVGAVDFDPLPGRNGDGVRIELAAQLRAEEVQHHPFRAALLSGIAGWLSPGRGDSGTGGRVCPASSRACQAWGGCRFPARFPEPLVDDLAVRTGPAPHHPGALQGAADLVHPLPRGDARARGELVVIERLRADPDRRHDEVAMTVGRHA